MNQTTLWPPKRPVRRPTPMRLKLADISAARCGGDRIHQRTIPAQATHPRQVNLVVFDPKSGKPLQALSLGC